MGAAPSQHGRPAYQTAVNIGDEGPWPRAVDWQVRDVRTQHRATRLERQPRRVRGESDRGGSTSGQRCGSFANRRPRSVAASMKACMLTSATASLASPTGRLPGLIMRPGYDASASSRPA